MAGTPGIDNVSRRETVVFRGGALGDFVLTLPVLVRLRAEGAAVHLVADPRHGALARAAGLVQRVSRLEDPRWGALWSGGPADGLGGLLAGATRAVVLRPVEPGPVAGRLRRAGVGQVDVLDPRPPTDGSCHAADHLLSVLGEGPGPAVPGLALPDSTRDDRAQGIALVVPGAGGEAKRWPRRHVEAFVARWRAGRGRAAVLLGPVERERGERWDDLGVPVLTDGGPLEAAALLAGAQVVVGNDTGTTHLAAAVGAPVVALFGPTDPRTWAPRGARVRVLQAGSLDELAPARVVAEAREVAAIPAGGENADSTPVPVSTISE